MRSVQLRVHTYPIIRFGQSGYTVCQYKQGTHIGTLYTKHTVTLQGIRMYQ
jgi:hypothetical protein